MIKKDLETFMELLNKKEFAKAHEGLEDLWNLYKKNSHDKNKSLAIKGFINGATALRLYELRRVDGAKKVWQTYLKYKPMIDSLPSIYKNKYQEIESSLEYYWHTFSEQS